MPLLFSSSLDERSSKVLAAIGLIDFLKAANVSGLESRVLALDWTYSEVFSSSDKITELRLFLMDCEGLNRLLMGNLAILIRKMLNRLVLK